MRTPILTACLTAAALAASASATHGQSVPDAITAEGVPPLPGELVQSLAPYQNSRAALFQGWLGGLREVLITTRFADTNQVHHVATPGGARTQLTFLADRVLDVVPQPSGDRFVFLADQGGAENYQLFAARPRGAMPARLSDGRSRHVSPRWSNSGRHLAFSSNSRNGKDMDLYVIDVTTPGPARRLKEVSGDWSVADWSPDDRRVVALEFLSISESYVHVIDVESGRTETVTPRASADGKRVAHADVAWSKDGAALYWTSDRDAEFRRLARYDLAHGETTTLTASIPWNIEAFDLSDDGATIGLVANEDGIARLHVLDAATGAARPAPAVPAGQIAGLRFRKGSHEVGFSLTSARSATDVYSVDLDGGVLVRWTHSETGGLDPETFAEPALVHYPSFDGRTIPAFVYRPPARFAGPRPVVVDIHGGPESQYRPGFLGRANYLINELGITLIFPNVRGSAGYGKTYLKLDNGRLREDAVKDIGALLDWIARQPDLDASRVAVMGASYGGYMTLSTLTHYSSRLRAGIDVVGISNFVSFLENTQGYRRDLRRAEYGDERDPQMRTLLESISPLASAEKIEVPLLVAQGKNDPRVPAAESAQIVARVRRNGKPVWSIVASNEGHGFAKKTNQDYLQSAEVLFLKHYLLGNER